MMVIEYIDSPFVYTDTGDRLEINKLKGTPRIGSHINDNMEVTSGVYDPDCVGGSCPIK